MRSGDFRRLAAEVDIVVVLHVRVSLKA
jgi:hypothetical protein